MRTGIQRRRLTEAHERQFRSMHRAVISIGVELERLMVDCGYLEPTQRQVMTSEQVREASNEKQI